MWAPQLQGGEIEIKTWLQFFPIPGVTAQELLVVGALLVPVPQKRTGKVESLAVPALRHHVHLLANLFLVNLFRSLWVAIIEDAAFAVTETIDKQCFVIGADADIDGEHATLDVTDWRNFLCLPFAAIVGINQPKFRA